MKSLSSFKEIWLIDFEFTPFEGNLPKPICLVAKEFHSKKVLRFWEDDLESMTSSPFQEDSLVVAYYAIAEISCYLTLGWNLPKYLVDLYVEFRNITNEKKKFCGNGLLGALSFFGIDSITYAEKNEMRDLAIRGGPWKIEETAQLLDYCETDVVALEKLLEKMAPYLSTTFSVLRGDYIKCVGRIEKNGIPLDSEKLFLLIGEWHNLKERLIRRIDSDFNIFEGQVFKRDRWKKWLELNNISWPTHPSGALQLDENTFADMARIHPKIEPIRQLNLLLSKMRATALSVGADGRNRCMLSPFKSKTSRNQPSSTRFIFGPSVWLRGLIKPPKGFSLAYIDWSQQEFGIAAALSGDEKMKSAYNAEDPYFEFAKMAGAVPIDAQRKDFDTIREQYKQCALAVQYGMGADSLALRIGKTPLEARELLKIHKSTFSKFWEWSDRVVDYANYYGKLHTVFDWNIYTGDKASASSLRNFPMQANGSEIMRLATILGTERGVTICAPVHDAFLIEAPTVSIHQHVLTMQDAMSDASATVLNGFRLKSDVKYFHYPERYMDKRGSEMWKMVWEIIDELKVENSKPTHIRTANCAPLHT